MQVGRFFNWQAIFHLLIFFSAELPTGPLLSNVEGYELLMAQKHVLKIQNHRLNFSFRCTHSFCMICRIKGVLPPIPFKHRRSRTELLTLPLSSESQ